jgi:hypothetical protein
MTVVCMSVNAQAATSGNCGTDGHEADVTWELNGSQLVFSGTGEIKTYSTDMPTAYPWYAHANDIQSVIIGEGITNIPAWAFAMYENLVSIQIPSTLKTIGWSCLEETKIWNVSLPEGLETIEAYAFMMTPFSTVCIPSTVTEIGERAFGYCENLVSVGCYADVPPTLGSNAFGDSPIETVYVKSAKISTYKGAAGWSAFGDKIQSPAGYCGPDGSDDDGDDDVTKATWSFDMETRTLTIEGTKMGQYNRPWESAGMGGSGGGFNPDNNVGYPQGIYHIVIGEGITAIPAMAFYMEVGLKSVTLPSTLTSIGINAFGECFNIETITCDATNPPTLADAGNEDYVFYGESGPISTITAINVPAASVDAYKAAAGWSTYAALIRKASTIVDGNHWTTFYNASYSYEVDANTTVYKANLDGTTITTTPIGGNQIITAGNAVILKSTGIPVLTTTATESTGNFSGNSLQGSDGSVVSDGSAYALGYKNSIFAFFKVKSGSTIPAGKAYVIKSGSAPSYLEIVINDDSGVTGISSTLNNKEEIKDNAVYNLAGQRVENPTKGLYIVNGKKVIIK